MLHILKIVKFPIFKSIPCSANKDYFDADPDPQFKNNECLDEEKKLNVDLELHL